jgi:hypothetical protein
MKAIGYVRVSTDRQAEQGVSLEAQEAKIRAMATVQGAVPALRKRSGCFHLPRVVNLLTKYDNRFMAFCRLSFQVLHIHA